MNAKHHRDRSSSQLPSGPFARPLNVHDVPRDGLERTITASEQECVAIAEDIDLPAVGSLAVAFRIHPRAGGRYHVTGRLKANITQVCVVTLEAFSSNVEQAIDLTFAPEIAELEHRLPRRRERDAASPPARASASVPGSDDQEDPPDSIIDDTIDLGGVALEFLVLACDIYPHKPGVQFADVAIGDTDDPEPSAFAALQRLKDRP